MLGRLIQELGAIPIVTLFCSPDLVRYYEACSFLIHQAGRHAQKFTNLTSESAAMRCAARAPTVHARIQPVGQPSSRGRQWRRDRTEVLSAEPIAVSNELAGGGRAQSRRSARYAVALALTLITRRSVRSVLIASAGLREPVRHVAVRCAAFCQARRQPEWLGSLQPIPACTAHDVRSRAQAAEWTLDGQARKFHIHKTSLTVPRGAGWWMRRKYSAPRRLQG